MDEIPDDVMRAAREVWNEIAGPDMDYCDNHIDAVTPAIARAILAERNRWQQNDPAAYMIIAPGCRVGLTETMESIALSKAARNYPPGTEVRPVYFAAAIRTPDTQE